MRGRAAKGNVTSAESHKGGAHGVRARGMSVSQVIAASRRPLNRGSHLSGDTCHMMPRSLAPRAACAGPHRTGARPVRSLRGPSPVPKGPWRAISFPGETTRHHPRPPPGRGRRLSAARDSAGGSVVCDRPAPYGAGGRMRHGARGTARRRRALTGKRRMSLSLTGASVPDAGSVSVVRDALPHRRSDGPRFWLRGAGVRVSTRGAAPGQRAEGFLRRATAPAGEGERS